jgi:hypothetical protein
VGGRCKVLVDGVFLSDAVCLEVGGGGQSVFFVFKDESTDVRLRLRLRILFPV